MPLLALVLLSGPQGVVAASAAEAKPLGAGVTAPDAALRTVDGKRVSLTRELRGRRTVLVFYRGGWCPYCNLQLADLQKSEWQLKRLGYRMVAVTPDRPEELKKSIGKNGLSYTLFSDSNAAAMRAYGVAFRMEEALVVKYKAEYKIDLEAATGSKEHILPVPAVFLINPKGKITYVYSNPDYRVRLKSEELVAAARAAR